jgi:general transcription factor 3C polypeptide 2
MALCGSSGSTSRDFIEAVFPDMTSNPQNIRKPAKRRFPIYETNLLPYQAIPGGQELSSSFSVSPTLPKLKHALKSSTITPYSSSRCRLEFLP